MGGCCSKEPERRKGERGEYYCGDEEEGGGSARGGDGGARVRLEGSCRFASMHTQQGRKGVNQDAMTIWENFAGERGNIFCGVFDGHGPLGHKVARQVRDALPLKISSELKSIRLLDDLDETNGDSGALHDEGEQYDMNAGSCDLPWFSQWKASFVMAFEKMDEELGHHSNIDCFCSGSTAVSVVKQNEHLIIANLGDSRAVLCTRDAQHQLIPLQLTVDLKPNLPYEAERIKSCRGRVFALEEEPDVHRLWLPEEDCPGLAMARAFGDFCLKDFGLISTPQVSYRKLTEKDEFVVLATDGVWDVLSNKEVVDTVAASAGKRSDAARQLVERAVRAWKNKHPTSKIDDCAVVCLFLKPPNSSTRATPPAPAPPPVVSAANGMSPRESSSSSSESFKTARSEENSESVESVPADSSREEWTALEGVSRVNSLLKISRFGSALSWRRNKSVKVEEHGD